METNSLGPDEVALVLRRMKDGTIDFKVMTSEMVIDDVEHEKNMYTLYNIAVGLVSYVSGPGKATELFKVGQKVVEAAVDMETLK